MLLRFVDFRVKILVILEEKVLTEVNSCTHIFKAVVVSLSLTNLYSTSFSALENPQCHLLNIVILKTPLGKSNLSSACASHFTAL